MKKTIGIIGFGNMGSAIAERIKSKYKVFVFDKDKNKTKRLKGIRRIGSINNLVNSVDVIILAVKPQDFDVVLNELKGGITRQLIITIAAGKDTGYIEEVLGKIRIVRAMPNLPAKIGQGTICLAKGSHATGADLNFSDNLFSHLGKTIELKEGQMDAATAVSGSGPGYFYKLIRIENIDPNNGTEISEFAKNKFIPQLSASATKVGFNSDQARSLAVSTSAGTIALLRESGLTPAQLEKQVTSKKGTTEAGLKKLRGIVFLNEAVLAAYKRAKELSKKG